jgi:hypothetical protein
MKSFLLLFLVPFLLLGCTSNSDLPAIKDPGALVNDCDVLASKDTSGTIDLTQCPESIKSLGPVSVRREGKSIYITIFQGTGMGARGYIVSREKPLGSDHSFISETAYKDIYRFDFKP